MTAPKYTPAAAEKRVFDYSAITRFIEAEADKRMVSKWTLLGGALTRAALATPHTWLLPAIVEDVGGLNLLIVHAGPSGSGKGAGKAEIFSWPDTDVLDLEDGHQRLADVFVPITVASGEAFGSLFVETQQLPDPAGGKGKIPVSVRIRYAAWADFDEVDQVAAIGGRQGSTLTLEIRKAWSGSGIGTHTKVKANRASVQAHTYRLVVTVAAQPLRCGPIFEEEAGGTLQRVLWLDASVPKCDDEDEDLDVAPSRPMPITLPKFPATTGRYFFDVDPEIRREIRRDRRRQRWQDEDAHRNLVKLKAAASFAVLHGSTSITPEVWEVAEAIMSHSDGVRASVRLGLAKERSDQMAAKATTNARMEVISASQRDLMVDAVAKKVEKWLRANGPATANRVKQAAVTGVDRSLVADALDLLMERGEVMVCGQSRVKSPLYGVTS
ncbi:hypothetical protein ACWDTI_08700 [Gordonia sp. NPDC003424]